MHRYAKLGLPRQAKLISEEAVWCPMPGRRSLAIDPGEITTSDDEEENEKKPPHPIVYDLESGKELGTVPTPVPRQNVRIQCVQDRLFVVGRRSRKGTFYVEYVWTGEGFRLVRDLLK